MPWGAAEQCLAAGMDGYLSKPLQPASLLAMLADLAPTVGKTAHAATTSLGATSADLAVALDAERLDMLDAAMSPTELRDFLDLFLGQAAERDARLGIALAQGDLAALGREAHGILGAAGNVGARRISALAGALEDACRAGERNAAERLVGELTVASQTAATALRVWLERKPVSAAPLVDAR